MIVIEDLMVKLGSFTLQVDYLEVRDKEYFVVMGPSGVGKTVFLRTLIGFIKPLKGKIIVNGRDITNEPPENRGFALVPQDYALWPHMTVYENIAYGLKARGLDSQVIREKVEWIAGILEITDILDRYPNQISGGQQQRVALARALVVEPQLVLLDEPLANLDPRLRFKARSFLRELHMKLGFTAIHVTHNIVEALYLGDRIAYMEEGVIKHISTPIEFIKSPWSKPYLDEIEPILGMLSDIQ